MKIAKGFRSLTKAFFLLGLVSCTSTPEHFPDESPESAFEKIYSKEMQGLNRCLEDVQKRIPGYSTQITFEARIEKSGDPSDVKILSSTNEDKLFHSCLVQKIRSWKFPIHNPPRPYKVTQGLKFQKHDGI